MIMNKNDYNYSVLMSVYIKENPEYFRQSIESMLNQTLVPEQFVIVKDGPLSDELNEIIDVYFSMYKDMFTIVPLKENVGLGRALDEGLKYCRNELVARMDADDISLTERCEKQVQVFKEDNDLCIIGTMIDEFYDNPNNVVSSRIVPVKHEDIVKFMRRRSPFNHPSVMFKKSEVIRCGGYGKFRHKQDLDLFSRMVNYGCKTGNIDESLVLFRSNEGNFKRRKSWSYCKSYIDVQYEIWRRGHCSFFDLIYVIIGQTLLYISPMWMVKFLSNKLLRNNNKK